MQLQCLPLGSGASMDAELLSNRVECLECARTKGLSANEIHDSDRKNSDSAVQRRKGCRRDRKVPFDVLSFLSLSEAAGR